jgi:hypothetical protein
VVRAIPPDYARGAAQAAGLYHCSVCQSLVLYVSYKYISSRNNMLTLVIAFIIQIIKRRNVVRSLSLAYQQDLIAVDTDDYRLYECKYALLKPTRSQMSQFGSLYKYRLHLQLSLPLPSKEMNVTKVGRLRIP